MFFLILRRFFDEIFFCITYSLLYITNKRFKKHYFKVIFLILIFFCVQVQELIDFKNLKLHFEQLLA